MIITVVSVEPQLQAWPLALPSKSLRVQLLRTIPVSDKEITPIRLPKRREIEDLSNLVYEKLKGRNELPENLSYDERIRIGNELDSSFADLAGKLSRMLLGQAAGRLDAKRLLIVKDGALQYIPFNALPEPTAGSNVSSSPMLLNHEITVLPSATAVASLRDQAKVTVRPPSQKTLLMFADPVYNMIDKRAQQAIKPIAGLRSPEPELKFRRLAFSIIEKSKITAPSLLPSNEVKVWEGFDVNRSNATSSELALYRLVHFSTHGVFDFTNPNASGLVLSLFDPKGVPEQRPLLGINDIYNLNLSADMVVLSACQTALGKDIRGEGLVGITRGFMYAGAPRVVSSLWEVDDPTTADLMASFYGKMLREKVPIAMALQAAQKEIWKEHKQSPYYWATFELQGEWKGSIRP